MMARRMGFAGAPRRGLGSLAFLIFPALFFSFALVPQLGAAQTVDLVMLVDESGSLCGKKPPGDVALEVEGLVEALESVIVPRANAGGKVQVAVISFGTKVTLRLGLTDAKTNKDAIVAALRAIKASPECGETNLGTAVNKAKAILDGGTAPPGQRVINLVTDGVPTMPLTGAESYFQNACASARDAGYEIWALGIGKVNEASLISCTGSAARYFYAPTVAGFVTVEQQKLRTILGRAPVLDPDLWLTKTASAEAVKAGEELSWLLTVGNAGPVSETDALVSDPLPEGLTLLSLIPSQGRCQSNNNIIDCRLGRLPSGGRATITLITKVAPDFSGTLANTASVIGENEDLNKSNNKATATVRVTDPRSPNPGPGGPPQGEGITVDYKGELLDRARELLDLAWDLLADLGQRVFEPLKDAKDRKIEAQAGLESALKYGLDLALAIARARELIQTEAYNAEQAAFRGLQAAHDALRELEAEAASLIVELEQNTLAGNISQSYVDLLAKRVDEAGRPEAPLLVILSLLSWKDLDLVEMDKLLEQAQEYESEALAWLATAASCGANTDCQKRAVKEALAALKGSIKLVRQAEKSLWKIKDNLKAIKAWLCGFKQLVVRAPTLVIEEEEEVICPWCLPPLGATGAVELRIYSEDGAIRFVALGRGGEVVALRVEVFTLAGAKAFDSGFSAGNGLLWPMVNGRGEPLANGTYLYVVTLKSPSGELFRSEVRKLALLR